MGIRTLVHSLARAAKKPTILAVIFLICMVAAGLVVAGVKYRSSVFVHGEAVATSFSQLSADVKSATPSVPLPAALMYTGAVAQAQEASSPDTAHGLLPPASVRGTGARAAETRLAATKEVAKAPAKKKAAVATAARAETTTAASGGYYRLPAKGKNWGALHAHNGVDIANKCGTTINAAAPGTVSSIGRGWSGGYGNNVIVKHANGTDTLYAHLQSISVSMGEEVTAGDTLGTMGKTGESTGCHLHFEVHGAKNPFVNK